MIFTGTYPSYWRDLTLTEISGFSDEAVAKHSEDGF